MRCAAVVFLTVTVSFPLVFGYSGAPYSELPPFYSISFENKLLRNTHYAKIGEAPFVVSIQVHYFTRYDHVCTGILMKNRTTGKQFVLTTGFACPDLVNPAPELIPGLPAKKYRSSEEHKYYEVAAGFVRLNESFSAQRTKVERMFLPFPDFTWENLTANNIAIFFIRDFELNDKVQPILLPEPDDEYIGNATMFGWGLDFTSTRAKVQNHLSVVDVPMVDLEVCKQWFYELNTTNTVKKFFVPGSAVCAEFIDDENGLCYHGAPLTRRSKFHGNHVLLGVSMSAGDGCHGLGIGFFRRVTSLLTRILDTMNENRY